MATTERTQTATRRLRTTYIVALSLVATLTIASQIGLHSLIAGLGGDATLINVAGRQRMLSQRIAKTSFAVFNQLDHDRFEQSQASRTKLADALELWTTSHTALTTRGEYTDFPGENPEHIVEMYAALGDDFEQAVAAAHQILKLTESEALTPEQIEEGFELAQQVSDRADMYLPVMNNIVFAYDEASQQEVARLRTIELALMVITLVVLALEALLVFEPATRLARRALDEADEANAAKGDFLANMSHEIRTPVTAILGYAELLNTDYAGDRAKTEQASRTIHSNAHHLLGLINDILDVSKIEAGKLSVEQIPVNPVQVVEEAVSLIRPRAAQKNLPLQIDYASSLPNSIMSDPTRIRQVLLNLIVNSIKFTEKGKITVRASWKDQDQRLVFEVQDTGIGMTPEQLERIRQFEAFTQADSSTTRKFGGTGLGLRISKALSSLLNGDLYVDSRSGEGSTFRMEIQPQLPADAKFRSPEDIRQGLDEDAKFVAPIVSEEALRGRHLLLVEDGIDNQRLIKHYLTRSGAEVTVAENGQMALEAVESDATFDLILMDMQMPVLDGYAAARMLRKRGYKTPIIALTAHAMPEDRKKCIDAGCTEYLSKPVNRAKLIALCDSLLANLPLRITA